MSQIRNIFLISVAVFFTAVNCSPLLTSGPDLRPSPNKLHLCGARLLQTIVHACKAITHHTPEDLAENNLSPEYYYYYYDSSSSEENSGSGNKVKRAIANPSTVILSKCCTSGCSKADITKVCKILSTSALTPTTNPTTTIAKSQSEESNESTYEEEGSFQTNGELETTTAVYDLVMYQNNAGQLTNSVRGTELFNRYSYRIS